MTLSTYEEYRKAGYSKKFFEAHREEITLHKAAKQAFDDLGVKKIPKVKDLNEEYARLLSDKKTAYAEYRKLRDEAQELLIAQSNIGSIYDFAGGKLLRQEKEEQKR
jgi:predicted restriction endonuclease